MPEPIKVSCPNCGAELTLKDASQVGRRVPCPKCSTPFVIQRPGLDDADFVEVDEVWEDEPAQPRREGSARTGSIGSGSPPVGAGSGSKRSTERKLAASSGKNSTLIVGGVVAGILVVVGIIAAISSQMLGGGGVAEKPGTDPAAPAVVPGVSGQPGAASSNAAVSQTGVTDAACEELGRQLEAAFMTKQIPAISTQFDWNGLASQVLTGLKMSDKEKTDYTRGLTSSVQTSNGFLGTIVSRMGTGSVKFIRVRTTPAGKRILVRTLFEDGASNYIEWVPTMNEAGQLKIVDGYVYMSGELLTTTLRRVTIPMLAGGQPSLLNRLTGSEREAVKYLQHLQRMTAALQSGQHRQVLTVYEQLPDGLKQEKAILMQCLMAAQNVGDAEYLAVIETFEKQFPGDVALDFIRLDYLALKKDSQGVVEAIRRLEAAMGGDTYLHGLLALYLLELGQLAEARQAAEESMRIEPTLAMPYQVLVPLCVKEQKFEEALQFMKRLFETSGLEFLEMATDPDFAGFIQSPQYAEWQTYRQQKK